MVSEEKRAIFDLEFVSKKGSDKRNGILATKK
jgi:hypothetical protein